MLHKMMNRAAVSGPFAARNTMPLVGMYNQEIVSNLRVSQAKNNIKLFL
jgi:hypothetical protein